MQIVGELDVFRPLCENMRIDWNVSIEVHVLKGAYHAFDQSQITSKRPAPLFGILSYPGGNPMLYDAAKAREARELTRAFLDKHL